MNFHSPKGLTADLEPNALRGVKVALINMPIREQAMPNNPPVGLALLAARMRAYGAIPAIIDLNIYRIKDRSAQDRGLEHGRALTFSEARGLLGRTFAKIGEQHLVGLSGLITTLAWQTEIARTVREIDPGALLVSGGGLATQFGKVLFDWIPELDGVAHSEGDDITLKIALDAKTLRELGWGRAIGSGRLAPYYLEAVGQRPRFFYQGTRTANLDALPFPAYDLLREDVDGFPVLDRYLQAPVWGGAAKNSSATSFTMKRSISTVSSRGCPFACKFCFRGAQGERNYGVRSAENLAAEFIHYRNTYDVDFIGLLDDNFMVSPKRIRQLSEILEPMAHREGLRWGAHGRLDEAADLRPGEQSGSASSARLRVEDMARAGCIYIGFGAESASPRVLEAMGKGGFILSNGVLRIGEFEFPRTMIEGIRRTRGAGIHGNCTWIMGYPGETLQDLKTSIGFIAWQIEEATRGLSPGSSAHAIARQSVNTALFTATAYPGTEMFDHPRVRSQLAEVFGLSYERESKRPVADNAFRKYVLELNDATKLLATETGRPLNFSAIPDEQFLEIRSLIDAGRTLEVLDYHA